MDVVDGVEHYIVVMYFVQISTVFHYSKDGFCHNLLTSNFNPVLSWLCSMSICFALLERRRLEMLYSVIYAVMQKF